MPSVPRGVSPIIKEQDGRFYCPKCPKSFKHRYDYTMHEKSHSGTNPHYCETCNIYFPRLSKLAKHFRTKNHLRKLEESLDMSDEENNTRTMSGDDEDLDESATGEPPNKKIKDEPNSEASSSKKLQCKHCKKSFPDIAKQQIHLAACISKRSKRGSVLPKDYLKKRAKLQQFYCPLCDNKFTEYADINQHISDTHEIDDNTLFPCKTCDKTFVNKEKWVSHLNDTEHMAKLYVCFQATCCDKTFKTHKACYNHERVHTRQSPYFCEKCDRYFLKKHHLTVHLKGCQNSERPYACPYCSRTYKTSNQLQHHLDSGHSFQCATCQQNFSCKPYLKVHLEASPSCVKNLCSKCNNLEFDTAAELAFHKSEVHDAKGKRIYSCAECGQNYCEAYKLKQHMQFHATGRYPYQCTEENCDVICYKKSKLDSHIKRVHLKIFEYECETCGADFRSKKDHEEHRCREHGAESFICPICDKEFFTVKTYESHQLQHSKVSKQNVQHRQQDDSMLDLRSLTNLSMALDRSSNNDSIEEAVARPTQIEFKIPAIVTGKHLQSPRLEGEEEVVETTVVDASKIIPVDGEVEVDPDQLNNQQLQNDRQLQNNQFVTIKIAGEENSGDTVSTETMQQLKSTLSDLLSATLAGGDIENDVEIEDEPAPNEEEVMEIVLMPAVGNKDDDDVDGAGDVQQSTTEQEE